MKVEDLPLLDIRGQNMDDEQRSNVFVRKSRTPVGVLSHMEDQHHITSVSSYESSSYEPISSGVKGIIRKTMALVSGVKVNYKREGDVGPLTYAQSYRSNKDSSACDTANEDALVPTSPNRLFPMGSIIEMDLTKVSRKKRVQYKFVIKDGFIVWKNKKSLELDMIQDIRVGESAANYREGYGISDSFAERWITIIYLDFPNKLKTLHLIARTVKECTKFYMIVKGLVRQRQELMESISVPSNEQFANIHWQANVSAKKEDEDKDTLSLDDVKNLCHKFHIYCSPTYLERFFKLADINRNGLLNLKEFQLFIKLLTRRNDITEIWRDISKPGSVLDFEKFYNFLIDIQGESISRHLTEKIFEKYSIDGIMDEDLLLKFLSSQRYLKEVKEDYTRPLNEYFISSSHNTYILGNQVGGMASVEGYIQALQKGCRSLEIDIWDGDDGPVVCHGKLTSSIPLRNVIEVIRKYAFITSPYPLVLSLEIHCRSEGQFLIARLFEELLGSLLYMGNSFGALPSPMELKHKILLKSKKPKWNLDTVTSDSPSHSASSKSSCESEYDTSFSSSPYWKRRQPIPGISFTKKKVCVIDAILKLSAVHGIQFRNFSLPESKTPTHCFSLSERKFDNLCKDENQRLAIDKHNRRHLMRTYPHALRYKSSNFDPIKCWKVGVQMVATNWQTYDLGQQVNQAMFGSFDHKEFPWHPGYVRKPDYLLKQVSKTKDLLKIYESATSKISITIDIISAQLLPKLKSINKDTGITFAPFVVTDIIGDGLIGSIKVNQNGHTATFTQGLTKPCKDVGFNPVWKTTITAVLQNTSFNFIRFTVKNGDLNLGTCCIRLNYLKKGYRNIPLYSMTGEKFIFSTLFIKYNYSITEPNI
ncbi:phosphatidylinositol phospholipase C Ecym_3005 [Eremothecium cymbalariae DBVPG|uniref:Phosphoinositide phospholipase C n=1 Tax=Eremothecium cymbalariae (strain CBS 270.75 / DBVPG 7215 / KCTC 17166 / NRRL Y-17582) TaxID=931890 RepID=G8JQV5_ERECY|nr:Hypothetical protein Ecym_3005 [Eremothecium cymbalariae DBVPG\